jgi:hypothetical protein
VKAKKPKKAKKRNPITCAQCGGIDIMICRHFDLLRGWCQDEDRAGGLMDFDEEWEPTGDFLDFACRSCSHKWTSDEFTSMDELMDQVYGEVVYRNGSVRANLMSIRSLIADGTVPLGHKRRETGRPTGPTHHP